MAKTLLAHDGHHPCLSTIHDSSLSHGHEVESLDKGLVESIWVAAEPAQQDDSWLGQILCLISHADNLWQIRHTWVGQVWVRQVIVGGVIDRKCNEEG